MKRGNYMKKQINHFLAGIAALTVCITALPLPVQADYGVGGNGTAIMEYLDRGIYAVKSGNGMFVSWRWNANDANNAEFQLYRDGSLIYTSSAGTGATCYQDNSGSTNSKYRVDTVVNGTVVSSEECRFNSGTNYFDIPLNVPQGGVIKGEAYSYSPNDTVVGDVDGDGQYELFVKWDPSNSKDNSQVTNADKGIQGITGNVYIDCYTLTGQKLWRIDLGRNIRAGQHYTQMCVADFDCDGKAELITKTCDGTVDGSGKVIGDGSKVYVSDAGTILTGPEYLTLFEGATGKELNTIEFPVLRGDATSKTAESTWRDSYGNRCERYNGGIAYLDGVHPSAVYGRGYYTRMTVSAIDVVDKKLVKRWIFDTGFNPNAPGYGDGNHNMMAADVDNDGKQEICMGSTMIDDNGTLLWCTRKGHGDAMHLGDLVPERPGLELFMCHEESPYGVSLIDAKDGSIIFHIDGDKDTGRCCGDNVYAGNAGAELCGSRPANTVLKTNGQTLTNNGMPTNFLIYWDGDLEREFLDDINISKMNAPNKIDTIFSGTGCYSNNGTKAVPCLTADLFGDWREELVLRTTDNSKLRIWCTTAETTVRLTTLMHDMQYRAQNCCQQSAYNQPPHVSYYLDSDAPLPERPNVIINGEATNPPEPIKYEDGQYITNLTVNDTANAANWSVVTEPKQTGSAVFGDRAFTFTAMSETLSGAEWIQTACESKKYAGEEAFFTAGADIIAYVALDTRITDVPAWLGDWTKTDDALTDDGNPVVTYQLYKKDFAAGEKVTLGVLNQTSCVNYTVAVTAQKAAPVIGDINADGVCDKTDLVMMRDYLLTISTLTPEQGAIADLNKDGKLTAVDLSLLKQILL